MNLVAFLGRFVSNFLAFLVTVSVGVLEPTEILIENKFILRFECLFYLLVRVDPFFIAYFNLVRI